MRVNTEETIRRGIAARDKAGSWMELRKSSVADRSDRSGQFDPGHANARTVKTG